jgi:Ca-activated chloride channel family protein
MSYRTIAAFIVTLCSMLAAPVEAGQPIGLEARLANAVMKGGEAGKNYLKVTLQGCKPEPSQSRMPVNVAFVIDRSGSMQGMPIAQAREAAVMAVNRLLPIDIASLVIFDHQVDVLAPAQRVADPGGFADLIRQVGPRGTTAIHAGVLAGAAEVAKNRDSQRLNRVVLLSDGRANVGPSRPEEFAVLGRLLQSQGISVSTIGLGLGYNEDLMLQLARASDGNHAFAREPNDLVRIFNKEFDEVLASCAQTVSVDVELEPGIRPVRALSRDGTIDGQRASFTLGQVYAATEHYVLLEVEVDGAVDSTRAGDGERQLGLVKVAYAAPAGGARQSLQAAVRGRFSASDAEVKAGADPKVAEAVVEQVTRERARRAVELQDQGRITEARDLLLQNATEIRSLAATVKPTQRMLDLEKQYQALGTQAAPATPMQMRLDRKVLRQLDAGMAGYGVRY